MDLYNFSERVLQFEKIAFSLERLYGRIFLTELGGTFFADFLSGVFFS